MPSPSAKEPPRLVRWWENLPIGVQIGVVGPTSVLVLWAIHVNFLGQPLGRGFTYGVFWGLLATLAIVGATRSERARRNARR